MKRRDQILYRDTEEQKLLGVSSGLGRYFDVDTNIVRVAFVALTLIGGGGLIAYVLLAVLLDPAPPGYYQTMELPDIGIDLDRPPPAPAPPVARGTDRPSSEMSTPPQDSDHEVAGWVADQTQ